MSRKDAQINGMQPRRGLYLINRTKGKTQGRVVRVEGDGTVVWWANKTGSAVSSDPENLRLAGYEWSLVPLSGYEVLKPFPYLEQHPEVPVYEVRASDF